MELTALDYRKYDALRDAFAEVWCGGCKSALYGE